MQQVWIFLTCLLCKRRHKKCWLGLLPRKCHLKATSMRTFMSCFQWRGLIAGWCNSLTSGNKVCIAFKESSSFLDKSPHAFKVLVTLCALHDWLHFCNNPHCPQKIMAHIIWKFVLCTCVQKKNGGPCLYGIFGVAHTCKRRRAEQLCWVFSPPCLTSCSALIIGRHQLCPIVWHTSRERRLAQFLPSSIKNLSSLAPPVHKQHDRS